MLYFVIIASCKTLLLRNIFGVSAFAPGWGLSGFVESTPSLLPMPELSNTESISCKILWASYIFLMLINSMVFSIFSDTMRSHSGLMHNSTAFSTLESGVWFPDKLPDEIGFAKLVYDVTAAAVALPVLIDPDAADFMSYCCLPRAPSYSCILNLIYS